MFYTIKQTWKNIAISMRNELVLLCTTSCTQMVLRKIYVKEVLQNQNARQFESSANRFSIKNWVKNWVKSVNSIW